VLLCLFVAISLPAHRIQYCDRTQTDALGTGLSCQVTFRLHLMALMRIGYEIGNRFQVCKAENQGPGPLLGEAFNSAGVDVVERRARTGSVALNKIHTPSRA